MRRSARYAAASSAKKIKPTSNPGMPLVGSFVVGVSVGDAVRVGAVVDSSVGVIADVSAGTDVGVSAGVGVSNQPGGYVPLRSPPSEGGLVSPAIPYMLKCDTLAHTYPSLPQTFAHT